MNSISPFINSAINSAQESIQWANHGNTAVIVAINTLFFFIVRSVVNSLDKRVGFPTKLLSCRTARARVIIMHGCSAGLTVCLLGFLFSKIIQSPLNKWIVTIATLAAFADRISSHPLRKYG